MSTNPPTLTREQWRTVLDDTDRPTDVWGVGVDDRGGHRDILTRPKGRGFPLPPHTLLIQSKFFAGQSPIPVSYGSVDSVVEERDVLVLQYFLDLIWVRMGNTYASVGALRSMEQNNATMATLTEHLSAADNTDDSIDGAAKITHIQNGKGVWQIDDGERLEDDPDEYRVECSCGEEFGSWGNAIRHAEEE